MKKFIILSSLLLSASLMIISCGNNKKKPSIEEEISVADTYLSDDLRLEIDSLMSALNRVHTGKLFQDIRSGAFTLDAKEKNLKPTYLMPLSKAEQLSSISQKNRALALYSIDRDVAKLYGQPIDQYDALLKKLATEVDAKIYVDNLLVTSEEEDVPYKDAERLNIEVISAIDSASLNLLVERRASAFIETMYIISQSPDRFFQNFTDRDAADVTYQIVLLLDTMDKLMEIHPGLQGMKLALEPLRALNAITKKELITQVKTMDQQIKSIRNALLN